jgi:AraC-type DNA-binding domain-containing proteins
MANWETSERGYGSLFVRQCGWEECKPGYQFGPSVRDHYLIHFVAHGKGRFFADGREHSLSAGQAFIIFPEQMATYRADEMNPWCYGWVGYSGDDALMLTRQAGLLKEAPIATCQNAELAQALLQAMLSDASQMRMGALAALGGLYRFLALLGQNANNTPDERQAYYEKALWFMKGQYQHELSVEEVAAFVGLSRSQLFRVFKQAANISPKESLTAIRAGRARALIETTNLSAGEIAASVGVSSPQRLNVMLKQVYHMTMTQLRKKA